MAKDTSISIRIDSDLKEHAENVIEQFGLNMTIVVNMLFRQIVRDQAIPLSLSLRPSASTADELILAKTDRANGYRGRSLEDVVTDMGHIVAEAEVKYGKKEV